MRISLSSLVLAMLVVPGIAGASSPVTQPPPPPIASQWRCNGLDPKDTIIPVVLELDATRACHARVVPPDGTPERPRVCIGNKATWEVTNTCGRDVEVTFAFNPFTKDKTDTVRTTKRVSSPVIRDNARETTGSNPPYKYDILIDGVIDLDPEIEIEKRRR
jgi:hypothetical protein